MKKTLAIYRKELKHFFYSPIAYIAIAVFAVLAGYFFYVYLSSFVQASVMDAMRAQQYRMQPQKFNVNMQLIRPYLGFLAIISLFILPLVTMRLFSEEKKAGTVELLYTSPLPVSNIVIGKFLAGITFYFVMLLPTILYQGILFIYGTPEFLPVLSGYLGLLLLGSAFIAGGLFISTLTENQIIAAIGGFGLSLLLWVIGAGASYSGPGLASVLNYLSIINHFQDFSQGVIDSQNVSYYILFSAFGLYLSFKSVESTKWRA